MIRIAIITAETRCFVFLLFILNITAPIRLLTDCHQSNSERILYMKLIILASLILFSACLSLAIKRGRRAQAAEEKSFWEREREANSVRRKPLDNLDYITIPFEHLPVNRLTDDPTVSECLEILQNLSELHIVNLTGFSNTDLKLEYGAANITALSEYDQNYTLLARTLQKWADVLLENGFSDEAQTIMEFAISTHTDISRTYYELAELYASHIETEKVHELIDAAESLPSSHKDTIVRTLQESYL